MHDGVYRKAVGVFVWYEDDILVLLRVAGGYWGLPGGKVDADESIQEAARRELREETGIVVNLNILHPLGSHRLDYGVDGLWEYASYEIALPTLPNVVLNPAEHSEYQWATPGNLLRCKRKKVPIFPGLIQVMLDFGYLSPQFIGGVYGIKIQRVL
ncbi:MAG: NUDIX hydrolase [Candidatus Moraniibacteriota bacterium]|nr:MAG: NUDIX hydrolase [Candidatus Moranbacteria bacterium]